MSTVRWIGNALAVAQVDTLTVGGTIEVADEFYATINGKVFKYIGASTTAATVATGFAAAWNLLDSSLYPEFAEITAAATSGGALTLTADTAGKPFICTVSTTESGGGAADSQTFGTSATIANSGPKDWSTAANWSGAAVPVNSDDVYIDQGGDILYGLAQSAVTLTSLNILQSYTGKIGLPVTNKDNANSNQQYPEYRDQYLAIGATSCTIGAGEGNGSGRLKLNFGSAQTTVRVLNSGSPAETGIASIILKGTHASNALHVTRGKVDVARFPGETATLLTLNVGYADNVQSDSTVYLGPGVTLTNATITQIGGKLTTNSATSGTATVTLWNGDLYLQAGGQLGLAVRGGTCHYNTSGTLGGAPVVSGAGHLDFSQDLRAKTVTNPVEVYGEDAKVSDPNKVVGTLVLDMNEGSLSSNIDIGRNVRITRGTPA